MSNFFTVSNEGKVRKYNGASLNTLSHHYGDSSPNQLRYLFHDLSGVLWLTSSKWCATVNRNLSSKITTLPLTSQLTLMK